jgi:hypothetical protein|tara:strand:- start:73 stop:591 length:519 start_codon:yes stop_codon:yes gene_type:complete
MKNLNNIIKKVLKEETQRYMFFSNLEQMKRQCEILLGKDKKMIESILDNGHDWAQDHIAESKNNMDQVFDFIMNEIEGDDFSSEEVMEDDNIIDDLAMVDDVNGDPGTALALYQMTEGRKKAGTKLCARGVASAKSKYDVYPSAYSNGHAVQVCKGKIKGLDGKKHCSGAYC